MLIGVADKMVEFGERSVKHIESRGLNCLLELLETLYNNQQSYRKKSAIAMIASPTQWDFPRSNMRSELGLMRPVLSLMKPTYN